MNLLEREDETSDVKLMRKLYEGKAAHLTWPGEKGIVQGVVQRIRGVAPLIYNFQVLRVGNGVNPVREVEGTLREVLDTLDFLKKGDKSS